MPWGIQWGYTVPGLQAGAVTPWRQKLLRTPARCLARLLGRGYRGLVSSRRKEEWSWRTADGAGSELWCQQQHVRSLALREVWVAALLGVVDGPSLSCLGRRVGVCFSLCESRVGFAAAAGRPVMHVVGQRVCREGFGGAVGDGVDVSGGVSTA